MSICEDIFPDEWHQIGWIVKELNRTTLVHVNIISILVQNLFFKYQEEHRIRYIQ